MTAQFGGRKEVLWTVLADMLLCGLCVPAFVVLEVLFKEHSEMKTLVTVWATEVWGCCVCPHVLPHVSGCLALHPTDCAREGAAGVMNGEMNPQTPDGGKHRWANLALQ